MDKTIKIKQEMNKTTKQIQTLMHWSASHTFHWAVCVARICLQCSDTTIDCTEEILSVGPTEIISIIYKKLILNLRGGGIMWWPCRNFSDWKVTAATQQGWLFLTHRTRMFCFNSVWVFYFYQTLCCLIDFWLRFVFSCLIMTYSSVISTNKSSKASGLQFFW